MALALSGRHRTGHTGQTGQDRFIKLCAGAGRCCTAGLGWSVKALGSGLLVRRHTCTVAELSERSARIT